MIKVNYLQTIRNDATTKMPETFLFGSNVRATIQEATASAKETEATTGVPTVAAIAPFNPMFDIVQLWEINAKHFDPTGMAEATYQLETTQCLECACTTSKQYGRGFSIDLIKSKNGLFYVRAFDHSSTTHRERENFWCFQDDEAKARAMFAFLVSYDAAFIAGKPMPQINF